MITSVYNCLTTGITIQKISLALTLAIMFGIMNYHVYQNDNSEKWLSIPVPAILDKSTQESIQKDTGQTQVIQTQTQVKQQSNVAGQQVPTTKFKSIIMTKSKTMDAPVKSKSIASQDKITETKGWNNKNSSTANHSLFLGMPWMRGRLGNQMFEYAGLLGIAEKHKRKPVIKSNSMIINYFKINPEYIITLPNNETKDIEKWKGIGERAYGKFDKGLFEPLPQVNLKLTAFLQSFKYFQHIINEIKQEFRFRDNIQKIATDIFKKIIPYGGKTIPIGIHIRRGDYLSTDQVKNGRLVMPKSYFIKAMQYFRDKYTKLKFLVTSDANGWSKQNIVGKDVVHVKPASAEVHMAVLCMCSHMIMSSGTYGFWPAYLSDGEVIYYTPPFKPGSTLDRGFSADDFYPPNWIAMGE